MKGTFVTGPGRPASGDSPAEKLYGAEPQSRGSGDRSDPTTETAAKLYPEERRLSSPIQQVLNRRSDDLAVGLAMNEGERTALGRRVERALVTLGIGPYDYALAETLVDGTVSSLLRADRGESADDKREFTFNQDTRRELHATYGEAVSNEHLKGVERSLKGTELSRLIAEANLGNHPTIVRGLVEWYRAERLGR